jgi:phosphoglycerate dehydrogenase-like enzyme
VNVVISVASAQASWELPPQHVDRLRGLFAEHLFVDARSGGGIRRALSDADVALTPVIDPAVVSSLHRLKWVQCPTASVSALLSRELASSDIVVTNARGIRSRAIAEHVICVTIALAHQLHVAAVHQVQREWSLSLIEGNSAVHTLCGRRMGIVGLGSVGAEIARIARALGLHVSALRRRPAEPCPAVGPDCIDEVLPLDQLYELLAKSDVVVLCLPDTAHTKHIIDGKAIDHMKKGALLINVARGALVDDACLIAALRAGRLGGAALDVFNREPLGHDSPYWDLPNVIITPHVSGAMADYWTPLMNLFAENLRRYTSGGALLNVVDKEAGY